MGQCCSAREHPEDQRTTKDGRAEVRALGKEAVSGCVSAKPEFHTWVWGPVLLAFLAWLCIPRCWFSSADGLLRFWGGSPALWVLVFCFFCLLSMCSGKPAATEAPAQRTLLHCVEDRDLDTFRPSAQQAARMLQRGEDPYIGQRLNYLQGTDVPFEPLLTELSSKEQRAFGEMEFRFPAALACSQDIDRASLRQVPDRFTMLRFLQADCYNVDCAIKRLLRTLAWRQGFKLDEFISDPDERAVQLYFHLRCRRIIGFDKHGRTLMLDALGEFFGSDNAAVAMSMQKWLQAFAFELTIISASFRKASLLQRRPIHRLAYIGDLAGLRLNQCRKLIPFLQNLTKEVDTHFPECAGTIVLINAPYFFAMLFRLVRVFLDQRTADSIIVKAGIPKEFLVEAFGADIVPVAYGGRLNYAMPRVPPYQTVLGDLGLAAPLS